MTGDLDIDRRISASSDDLWEACATAEGLQGWFADRIIGFVAPGRTVRLEWPGLGAAVAVEVSEYAPNRRVAFRNGDTVVSLSVGEGLVSLTHSGLSDDDDRQGFAASWRVALSVLAHGLEWHRGKPRKVQWFCARARTTARLAHFYYSDSQGLSAWLGRGSNLGAEGQEYALESFFGAPMTGTVLVRDGERDVALSWREQENSVLVLRSLPASGFEEGRMLAVCWSRWASGTADAADRDARIADELRRCVGRLARELDRSGIA